MIKKIEEKLGKDITRILILFISTRIFLTMIGMISRWVINTIKSYGWNLHEKLFLDIWGLWDSSWYLSIARHGYSATLGTGINEGQANYAFFPLYPMLMKIFGIFGQEYIAGIVISNICLIISCILLYKLVRIDFDENISYRSVKYMILFPTAFILSGIFTESLYLCLMISCIYYARKEKYWIAGTLGFLLALTRSLGVVIALPLFIEYIRQKYKTQKPIQTDILSIGLIPLGLGLFATYCYFLTGDFLAFAHIQSAWNRELINPIIALYQGLTGTNINMAFSALFSITYLGLLFYGYFKIRFSYFITGLYHMLIPLCYGLLSMPRLTLVAFPLFIITGSYTKNKYVDENATIIFALVQGCLMVIWVTGFHLII